MQQNDSLADGCHQVGNMATASDKHDERVHTFEHGCEAATAAAAANPLLQFSARCIARKELPYAIALRDGVADRAALYDGRGPLGEAEEDDEAATWAKWWWEEGGRHGKPPQLAAGRPSL